MVEVGLACTYCDDVLATETNEQGMLRCDEFHECVGETPGWVGNIDSHGIVMKEFVNVVQLD